MLQAIEAGAGMLGTTRAVCRKSYIHPAILDSYIDGTLFEVPVRRSRQAGRKVEARLRPEEVATLAILQLRASKDARKKKAA